MQAAYAELHSYSSDPACMGDVAALRVRMLTNEGLDKEAVRFIAGQIHRYPQHKELWTVLAKHLVRNRLSSNGNNKIVISKTSVTV